MDTIDSTMWNNSQWKAAQEDIASAATCAIGGTTSANVRITGTTTITSFGTIADGTTRWVRMQSALTLTHNGTSLILPGSANITTAANDCFRARSLGSGNWLVTNYQKASGLPVIGSQFKIGTFSRDSSTSSGTQAVTGVGFQPRRVKFNAMAAGTALSVGQDDGTTAQAVFSGDNGVAGATNYNATNSIAIAAASSASYVGKISAFGADGFTITWVKSGNLTETIVVQYEAES